MSNDASEFRFLAGDAARVERTTALPTVIRTEFQLADGSGSLSALRFSPEQPAQLVVLHGAGLNAHSFDPMLLALDRPAISVDLPGHGRSSWRADADYRPEIIAPAIVEFLVALADAQPDTPFQLLGHSLGGLAAAYAAAAFEQLRPGMLRELMIVDITPGVSPSTDGAGVAEFITGQRSFANVDEAVDRAIAFGIGSDRTALTRGVTLNTRLREDGRLEWTHHFAHLAGLPSAPAADETDAGTADAEQSAAAQADPRPYAGAWNALASLTCGVVQFAASAGMVSQELAGEWADRLPLATIAMLEGPHNLHEAVPLDLADHIRALDPR